MIVYTDGSCSMTKGGWAWAVDGGPLDYGFVGKTTSQRMEMMAALQAAKTLEGPIHIISDSRYVVNCFNQKWYKKWLRNDWQTSTHQSVKNVDLWKPLIALVLEKEITFEWVKGHSDNKMNDYVDMLAVSARELGINKPGV